MPTTPPRVFAVRFDAAALAEDSAHATSAGRNVLKQTVRRLHRRGIPTTELYACQATGRDQTRLPGCAKTYLPPPDGPWGMVFQLRIDSQQGPFLACLAFGQRHPAQPWQRTVYQTAHHRLHNQT